MAEAIQGIDVTLPEPGSGEEWHFRRGGERYGDVLAEKVRAAIGIAYGAGLLTDDVNDTLLVSAMRDTYSMIERLRTMSYPEHHLRAFEEGCLAGYRSAMESFSTRKPN